jgi:aminotransferase
MLTRPFATGCSLVDGGAPMNDAAGSGAVRSGEKATSIRYSLMDLARTRGDVISLGRGDPDLDTPAPIIDGALDLFARPEYQSLAEEERLRGLGQLRRGIADRMRVERGVEVDPDTEIVITNGAQEGLFLAMLALVDPGDRIVCPDPRYTSYDQAIGAAGGEIISIPTGGDEPFELSASALRAYGGDAKLLVFVNPSNPTGAFVGAEGIRELAAAAAEMGLIVLSDEIYEDLVFDGRPFLSFLAVEGARERTVLLSGFSKSYAMTGFRVGYLVGPPAFTEAVAAIKATTSGPCPVFSQLTALAALQADSDYRAAYLEVYEGRRRALLDGFDQLGIPYGPNGGGLFVWADVTRFGIGAEEFCYRLLDEAGVLMFPGNSFGDRWKNWVRVSLLAPEESVRAAIDRILGFVTHLETS